MTQKSFSYIPSVEDRRARRAAKMAHHAKVNRVNDQDWKQEVALLSAASLAGEASMMELLGYTKRNR